MTDHTPTTEEVRDTFTWGASACGCCAEYRDEDYEKFDRWLAALIRQAKAEALEEAANRWTQDGWANRIPQRGSSRSQIILGMTQSAGDYLRARAAEYRKGESDDQPA